MSNLMKYDTISIWLATGGIILSSVAIGWNIFRDLINKGKLRVVCFIGYVTADPDTRDKLIYNITNIGKKPIIADKVMGAYKKEKFSFKRWQKSCSTFFINPRYIPKKLEPGEHVAEWTYIDQKFKLENIKHLFVIDTVGRIYKAKKKDVNKVNEKISEILSSNTHSK